MKVTAEVIASKLDEEIKSIALEQDITTALAENANVQFGVPTGDIMDYLSGRKKTSEANTQDLFMLCWTFDYTRKTNLAKEFFTPSEVRELTKMQVVPLKANFPLRIKCVQVDDDQWIGRCDVHFLMELRNSQLINYNANAQRTMTRVVRQGIEQWKITLNKKAVRSIKESYKTNAYIPNTITLNIPEDQYDFQYDSNKNELIINSLDSFDITDGYHRYMAMSELWDEDRHFNYPMELRITHFPDSKAKQFIYQEDQKTPMTRIDSESMNMSAPANMVTERLNSDPNFLLSGQISRNEGMINFGEFSSCVKFFYFKGKGYTKAESVMAINKVKRELVEKLNPVFDTDKLKDHYKFKDLMVIFVGIQDGVEPRLIQRAVEKDSALNSDKFSTKTPRKGLVSDVKKFMREGA